MWVEYWIRKAHPSFEEYELLAEKYDDYRWICEIELPLINKTVKAISEKEINAMLIASEKAAKLIDEYMQEHPELEIKNMFKGKRWEIVGDENGKFLSMGMSSAWRREQGKQMQKMVEKTFDTLGKAIDKIERINGSTKNLVIHVFDKSIFPEDMDNHQILNEVSDKVAKLYKTLVNGGCVIRDNLVIYAGYTFDWKGE